MPVAWSIDGGIVRLISDEEATFAEWRDALYAALASPGNRAGMSIWHDVRRMRRVPTALEAQQRVDILARCTMLYKVRRWATTADRDAVYGIGRMGEALTSIANGEFRIFREPVEAEEWARGR